jgi:NADH:ubiquinone oxidoreductase subunit F (NADH-binding)/(2Fe-2S) ferredoxin/NAD-dependent dihydropyrimidine dehydrogenase PreA subunit
MPRVTLDNLEQLQSDAQKLHAGFKSMLMVCAGTGCVAAKSLPIRDAFQQELKKRGLDKDVAVVGTGCNGFCAHGPICVVQPEGVFYERLRADAVPDLIEAHFFKKAPLDKYLYKKHGTERAIPLEKDIEFFAKQQCIALRNRGKIDPEDISDAIRTGAYQALRKILKEKVEADTIVGWLLRSGIRGRGGGGFPTGLKWQTCLKAARERTVRPYVVCNSDEGDPGAFMDRSIVEADPHAVLEGMLIGARALGATEGYVYIRKEYPLALQRLRKAIAQAREAGLLGKGIMGTDMEFDITIHQGAGAFVCGESTALMASMEGRAGEPRAKYVHTVEYGFRNQPTVLNNVETWANIPQVVLKGAEWFASIGTGDVSKNPWNGSSGTKVFSLVGNICNSGLVEVPMGISLREIVFDIGGGIPNSRKFKAVQTGGPSGGCLPESLLDLKVDFDTLTEAGSMMGSGGMIVMDDRTCMVDVARYFVDFLCDESCGKCTPCREGLTALREILNGITQGKGKLTDLQLLEDLGAMLTDGSLCGLGQSAANPVLSTLRYFRQEYEAHIRDHKCPAGVCKALVKYTINSETCTGCTLCVKPCPTDAIRGELKKVHLIEQEKCIQCGTCMDACTFDAVIVQ